MASSGASSSLWRWDAFLSFEGGIRYQFADHLCRALRGMGLRIFRDDEGLERGGEIQSSLSKAIEESKVAIVVFSEYYPRSRWCLDELEMIMRSRGEKGQTVIPVFYHVDPSDVRKQTGKFGEAFAGYGKVAGERVMRWRRALTEAGNLAGWHVQQGYESGIVHDIALRAYKLNFKYLHVDDNLIGMDSRLEEMLSLLRMESNHVIGIYGIGGIGKTTLAKVIFNQIAHQFECACFLSNVAEGEKRHGLLELQRQLLADILEGDYRHLRKTNEGTGLINMALCTRKVLLILDDVSDLTQLKFLAGEHLLFDSGSRVIITTRDMNLPLKHGVEQLYKVPELRLEEAFQLFCSMAFKKNLPEEGFGNLSISAVSYCNGLPLAVKIVGSLLHGKTMYEWKNQLRKLQRVLESKIEAALRISLDGLDQTEKDLFLDIACFFTGEDTNFAERILDSSNFFASGMSRLSERCLVRILDNKIMMHDLIQQMGCQIIREACTTQPGKRSRLCDPEDVHAVLTQNTGTEAIEVISFDLSASKEIRFTTEAFEKMNRLRLLRVYWDGHLSYDSNREQLPKGFKFPSDELRYFRWDGWSLESLPSDFKGEKLVELSLKHSSLTHLWKENKHLENLKVMDLSHSRYLVEVPDLSGSPSLETLNLDGCTSLQEVHPSIARLKNLTILNLGNCERLYYFPTITGLEKLKVFNLSGCSRLEKFPDIKANMEFLLELNLEATAILELPASVGYLQGLHLLNMKDCKNLKILPGSICALKSLKTLILSGCSKLERIPEIPEVMEHLEELLLDETSIRKLPDSILRLEGLLFLNLSKCKNLVSLPDSICDLKSLKTLIVSGCSELNSLPKNLGRLSSLRRLQAERTAITQPPISLVYLTNLEELSFRGCQGSTSNFSISYFIPRLWHRENSDGLGLQIPSLSGLRSLKYLDLSNCKLMEGAIDHNLCHLESLKVLNLSRNCMVNIPANVSELPNLKVLLVRQCEQLQTILKLPPSIKLVDACDCTSLKSLPAPSPIIRQQGMLSSLLQQSLLSSTLLGPVEFKLWNCSGLLQDDAAMALEKLHQNLFPEIGYTIVIPGTRIPKWPWHENTEASVSADLPPHGLNNDFLGIILCVVFALEEGETIQRPGKIFCNFECGEGPYFSHSISWTHSGDRVVEKDHVCMMYLPRTEFVKSKSIYDRVFKHIKASFSLSGASHKVKKCAIRLMYTPNN